MNDLNVDTRPSSQNSQFADLGQQVDTLSKQVDTGPSSQNSLLHILDSVSTLPPGKVDELRKLFILKVDGCHFTKLTLVHTPRAENILADSLASLASSIPIQQGRSFETVFVQCLKVPSHVDSWFAQLKSPSLRVHALSKEPEINLEDVHPWYFDIENYLKDGSFLDYATSSDR
ncbi:hypothetical protein Taro_023041 [Colocasia esculenta]|uniref:Uncharacterized protein n=1 Tax=Colocasia esculenta TaxID=4460 RepID=A0A843VG83_COLES|nr:hypothetical protein [Colocasia esculenta]